MLVAAACARLSTEDPQAPPPEQSVDAATPAQDSKATQALPKLSEPAQAYLADCHHRFKQKSEETEEVADECLFREFDQNCSPDPSGCWDKGQACRDACGKPCESCDDTCAGGCDGCMGKCAADDDACRHACAQARVGCRDACLAARDKCSNDDCSKAEEECNTAHLALREQKCPRCEQINACMNEALEKGGDREPQAICRPKFKREPAECFEWCFEW